jgi:hypothetical protein
VYKLRFKERGENNITIIIATMKTNRMIIVLLILVLFVSDKELGAQTVATRTLLTGLIYCGIWLYLQCCCNQTCCSIPPCISV